MKKRMYELENQIKIQSENLNKISALANKKEEKLNNDISEYIQQINDLKSELELLNSTITNLTEEKENNTIKLTELIHENEQLKKNKISNNSKSDAHNKKYEEIILKLKKNVMSLNEEKKALEEVIIKQEEKVNELSYKVNDCEKKLIVKDQELKDSIEYTAKLTSAINSQKKEIQNLKQNNSNNRNKNNNEEAVSILKLQNEIQNIKKELENKENKINILSMNNKILQGKVNKLSQTAKNGFNNNTININNNQNINNGNTIINKENKENKYNNFNYISGILPKTLDKNNHQIQDLKSLQGIQNVVEKKKMYIVAKSKELPKTPGKANARQNSSGYRVKNELYKNVEETNKIKHQNNQQSNMRNNSHAKNIKRTSNHNNINAIHENSNINKNNKLMEQKYKEIETKYKNEKKEKNKIKDDTLFDEDINNIDIKEEIISPAENEKIGVNIASIQIMSNMISQTLKPEPPKKNKNELSVNMSQDKEFQVIESYCVLSGQGDTINNTENNNSPKNGGEKVDDSKIEALQIQNLHNKVNQILNEF